MRKVKLICKNNKWVDFGNHTGFKDVTRECNNLIVGNSYEFSHMVMIKFEHSYHLYELISDFKSGSNINGYNIGTQFTIKDKELVVLSAYDLYNFFYSIEEIREIRLKKLLN